MNINSKPKELKFLKKKFYHLSQNELHSLIGKLKKSPHVHRTKVKKANYRKNFLDRKGYPQYGPGEYDGRHRKVKMQNIIDNEFKKI